MPRGALVILVGSVGSAKSSLLAALLGEMPALAGAVTVRGRVAYTAQDPWIQNATLRDNVLLGAPMERQRCAKGDMGCFPHGCICSGAAASCPACLLCGGPFAQLGMQRF